MFLGSLLLVLVAGEEYDYDSYNDAASDYGYIPVNETVLDEIISFGNITLDLSDLATYELVNDLKLPNLRPVRYLYGLSTLFINAVWEPFVEIEGFLFNLMTLEENEQIDYVSDNWRDAFNSTLPAKLFIAYKLAGFELGFIICLIIGFLFVTLFPFTGLLFCGCRCCDNCGGRLYQDMKDATSGWRIFHCLALMVTTLLMIAGTVLVFLANEWITQSTLELGPTTVANIDHVYNYADNIRIQSEELIEKYRDVDNGTKFELENLGDVIGEPVQAELQAQFDPVFTQLIQFEKHMNSILKNAETTANDASQLKEKMAIFEAELTSLKQAILTDLSFENCHKNEYCVELLSLTEYITITANFSQMSTMTTEIEELSQVIDDSNITRIINEGQDVIDAIPEAIQSLASMMDGPITTLLSKVQSQLESAINDVFNEVDLNTNDSVPLNNFRDLVEELSQNKISQTDHTRYQIGLAVGSLLAIIVGLNTVAIFLGFCGYKREATPTSRTGASNLGGVALMLSVVASFLFGWILMLVTTGVFAVGGHAERYMCQTVTQNEPNGNFTGLQFLYELGSSMGYNYPGDLLRPVNKTIENSTFVIDPNDYFKQCQNNSGMYQLLGLDEKLNIDDMLNITTFIDEIIDHFDSLAETLNQTSTGFLRHTHVQKLGAMKEGKWKHLNFDQFFADARASYSSVSMDTLALKINQTLKGFSENAEPMNNLEQATINVKLQEHEVRARMIRNKHVHSIDRITMRLEDEIYTLRDHAAGLEFIVDGLVESLIVLNDTLVNEAPSRLATRTRDYGRQNAQNFAVFVQWLKRQLTFNLGACQPVYEAYSQTMDIVCGYIVNSVNLFWFSLGWTTVLLVPSIIFASKLYKWFRRMDQEEYFEEFITYDSHHNNYYDSDSDSDYSDY